MCIRQEKVVLWVCRRPLCHFPSVDERWFSHNDKFGSNEHFYPFGIEHNYPWVTKGRLGPIMGILVLTVL